MRELMREVGRHSFSEQFYLAGGTSVALRLGHRRSVDLDFFSSTDDVAAQSREAIIGALARVGARTIENARGNLVLSAQGVHIAFLSYGYRLVEEPEHVEGIAIASLRDVGLMKLDALISRGSRKDFYDLYFILQRVSLQHLLRLGSVKYPHARDFPLMAAESLVLFDNADRDVQPDLLVDVPWPRVREYFIEQGRGLGETWFGDS